MTPRDLPRFANVREGIEARRKWRIRDVFYLAVFAVSVLIGADLIWPYPPV
ncbi:hypothetical protein AB3Y40_06645 [Yoonia sp. R2331]|uniref:hypothetical protein n=1 Tax=Yoonia sp. R2331 TaxID=3237238 RepID=UPI0034E3AF8C